MSKLVKQVTRILLLMGLESSTSRGVAAASISVLDDDSFSNAGMCSIEPNAQLSGGAGLSYAAMAFFFMVVIGLIVMLWKTLHRPRDIGGLGGQTRS